MKLSQISERAAVNFAAKLAPWLAPIPSAFFVARSSIVHLALPWPVAVIVAAIVETLGLATVNIVLRMWEWNQTKRKIDPASPVGIGVALGVIYLVTTLGLIVALEVWPALATYAPAMFPFLAVVGTVNLALIASQDRREAAIVTEKAERKAERQAKRQATGLQVSNDVSKISESDTLLDRMRQGRQAKHDARLDALLTFYLDNPNAGPSDAARAIGVSRQTIYSFTAELEQAGRLRRNGHAEVITTQ